MKTHFFILAGIALMVFGAGSSAISAESSGSFYGKIYADWYYDLGDTSPAKQPITKKSEIELTRVYMGYKYVIDDNFTVDALLDVQRADPVNGVTATFDTAAKNIGISLTEDDRYFAFLKVAYMAWKGILPHTTLSLGQMGYFAFNVQEGFWGYRYIYQMAMDKLGWETSADLGAAVKIEPVEMLKISAGVFNGDGYKASQDAYGNYRPALGVQINPVKDLTLYLFGDWMPVGKTSDNAQSTAVAFAGYNVMNKAKIGVEYDAQMNQKGVKDHNVNALSIFGMYSIVKSFEVFARFDMMSSKKDWNVKQDGQTIIGGVQYKPVSKIKLALDYQHSMLKPSGSIGGDRIYLNGEFAY